MLPTPLRPVLVPLLVNVIPELAKFSDIPLYGLYFLGWFLLCYGRNQIQAQVVQLTANYGNISVVTHRRNPSLFVVLVLGNLEKLAKYPAATLKNPNICPLGPHKTGPITIIRISVKSGHRKRATP
jgi:hypothetical protein